MLTDCNLRIDETSMVIFSSKRRACSRIVGCFKNVMIERLCLKLFEYKSKSLINDAGSSPREKNDIEIDGIESI